MNLNFEKTNPENISLAELVSYPEIHPMAYPEFKLCHCLFMTYPSPVELTKEIFVENDEASVRSFKSAVHDLERRGILKSNKTDTKETYVMTREFHELVKEQQP